MKIKKVAFGNSKEAFIEDRFKDGLNIIFSNDNNKGKTLLMQGLMYSIGYESIFPESFSFKEHYFYSEIDFDGRVYEFLRKKNSIIVKSKNIYQICNSVSELKYFFDEEIFKLPKIIKDGNEKIVDLTLLYELFFLGQDKRNTSSLISKGQYNKKDFINMLFSLKGIENLTPETYDSKNLKEQKIILENKIKSLKKKLSILKANSNIAEFSLKSIDTDKFEKTKKVLFDINGNISSLKKQRDREQSRKNKLENLLSELRSLNRNIDTGKVKCADCGSKRVIFSNNDFDFEISNLFVRQIILKSIKDDIEIKTETIEELTRSLNIEQEQLTKELKFVSPDYRDYILFDEEIIDSEQIDAEIHDFKEEIKTIKQKLLIKNNIESGKQNDQKSFLESVLVKMNYYYNLIDKSGVLVFPDLFTKKDETYSGSEEQEFYFSKLIALNKEINHTFPIIIDSFRDGEVASKKERAMLEIFKNLKKQIIVTSTLKDEEYSADKYVSDSKTNVLDYSDFQDSKILQSEYNKSFFKLTEGFEGVIRNKDD